ncbi:unnamed protein product [Polarella glacialis]|uniref:Uncharacterized protein n=1 Tax=Polarella glacialis TaxID=89957 RepID=A0A813HMI1_POLGL|nr:unnamed protein product [Polarella glacialis]CAE8638783.1 unnamed protein product [Polarella glacialis]
MPAMVMGQVVQSNPVQVGLPPRANQVVQATVLSGPPAHASGMGNVQQPPRQGNQMASGYQPGYQPGCQPGYQPGVQSAQQGSVPTCVVGQAIGVPAHAQDLYVGSGGQAMDGSYDDNFPAADPSFLAFLACCCCCWCIGIVAIMKSREVSLYNHAGDYKTAHEKRRQALRLIYLTILIGIAIDIIYFLWSATRRSQ